MPFNTCVFNAGFSVFSELEAKFSTVHCVVISVSHEPVRRLSSARTCWSSCWFRRGGCDWVPTRRMLTPSTAASTRDPGIPLLPSWERLTATPKIKQNNLKIKKYKDLFKMFPEDIEVSLWSRWCRCFWFRMPYSLVLWYKWFDTFAHLNQTLVWWRRESRGRGFNTWRGQTSGFRSVG